MINYKEELLNMTKNNPDILNLLSEAVRGDKDFMINIIKDNALAIQQVTEELRDDKEVVLTAVKNHGYWLRYASEEKQHDREIVFEAAKTDAVVLDIAKELAVDKNFIIELVKYNEDVLYYAPEQFRDDRIIMFEAIKYNENALTLASRRLKNEIETVGGVKAWVEAEINSIEILLENKDKYIQDIHNRFYLMEKYKDTYELVSFILQTKPSNMYSSLKDCLNKNVAVYFEEKVKSSEIQKPILESWNSCCSELNNIINSNDMSQLPSLCRGTQRSSGLDIIHEEELNLNNYTLEGYVDLFNERINTQVSRLDSLKDYLENLQEENIQQYTSEQLKNNEDRVKKKDKNLNNVADKSFSIKNKIKEMNIKAEARNASISKTISKEYKHETEK